MYDTVGEAQESQLYVSILDDLNDAPDEVRACWDESTGIWDDLYEAGYTGIDMNLDDLLSRSSFNVNLFFATETEKNFDMGSIVDSFGNDYREPRLEDIDAESLDNALSYLVNQQGHSVEEVFGNPDNAFIHSIREEIDENSSEAMSELCALVRMDAREMLDLIGKRSEAKGSLVLPRDCATMGLFTCPPNRAVYATKGMEEAGYLSMMDYSSPVKEGELYSILCGDLVAVGFDFETGENRDLSADEMSRVADYFTEVSKPGSGIEEVIAIRTGQRREEARSEDGRVTLKGEAQASRAASEKLAEGRDTGSPALDDHSIV